MEVGGSGAQTVVLSGPRTTFLDGAHQPNGASLALAVPGLVFPGGRTTAVNLGWERADPLSELSLPGPASLVMNDAEAAALGESQRRGGVDLVYVGLGTGVGGAAVVDGVVTGNLFGHGGGHGDGPCRCGEVGCLEARAAGWALPEVLTRADLERITAAVARAVRREPLATPPLVVLAGGLVRTHPGLLTLARVALCERSVEGTAAPPSAKSAAAWGLRSGLSLDEPTAR